MGDEEKKAKQKEKMQNVGSTIGSIVKIIKHLANPIIMWFAIGILIIVLLVGVIGFIISFPSGILGKLTGNIFGWTRYSNNVYKVSQEDLIELCKYLEEMGIKDLEGYGFVEEIERGEPTTNEEGVQTSKGEIKSVKSKYLEAYLVAERRTYVIDDYLEYIGGSVSGDYKQGYVYNRDFQYDQLIFDLAFGETFEEFWEPKNNVLGIKDIIKDMYNLENENYIINENLKEYQDSEFSKINKDEIKDKVKTMVLAYFKYETYIGSEVIEAYRYGKKLIGENEEFKDRFKQMLNIKISEKKEQYSKEDLVGTGLIHVVGSTLSDGQVVVGENNEHGISINEEKRQLIISTQQIDDTWSWLLSKFNLATTYNYAYDLNNWVCKYGKPVEFLVSMHLATGAPDFVYQVATSPAVDTRVYVDLFPVSNSLSLVTEEGGTTTAMDIINNACDNALPKYKEKIEWMKGVIDSIPDKYKEKEGFQSCYNSMKNAEDLSDFFLNFLLLRNMTLAPDYVDGLIPEIYQKKEDTYSRIIIDNEKYEDLATIGLITIKLNDAELGPYSYSDITDIRRELTKYESQSWNSATPYITKVVNHWYRNQYFTKKDATIDLSTKKTRIYRAIETATLLGSEQARMEDAIFALDGIEEKTLSKYLEEQEKIWKNLTTDDDIKTTITNKFERLKNLDLDLRTKKSMIESEIESVASLVSADVYEASIKATEDLGNVTTEDGISEYLNKQIEEWANLSIDEDKKTQIQNEFDAAKKEITGKITGSAYTVTGAPESFWQSIAETSEDTFGGGVAEEFMTNLWIKETRGADIIQLHNPIFEDNSQYIRNWLKEKYYIYANPNTSEESTTEGNTTTKTLSDSKVSQGKQYIDGKRALQELETMIEQCDGERKDISYMLRDLKELFEDFEFDLENVEVPAEKVLDNVMPDYVPYTPWPSIYETAEDNCTKMIYKTTEESKLIAPAQGIITKVQNNIIEIKFSSDDEKTSSTNGMILNIEIEEGSLNPSKSVNSDVKRGDEIGKVNPNSEGMIILKLRLFSATKQLLKIQNYMTVNSKSYDGENSIEEKEKIYLYNLQETEINIETNGWFGTGGETQETITSRVALMNTIFNKLSSPYYPKYKDIQSILGTTEEAERNNFFSYAKNNGPSRDTKLDQLESRNTEGKYAIKNALAGVDITKSYTLIGATQYIPLDDDYYKNNKVDNATKDGKLQDAEKLIIKFQFGNRMLGITEEEYTDYLGDIIEKKINEVIYTLNIKKYTQGFEEYNEVLAHFRNAKEVVVDYYKNGKFLEECSNGQVIESMRIVTNIAKSNIYQDVEDIEGQEGKQKVTDKFTITANSNYSTIWTFTYTKGAEGKIESDITVEHKAIKNI